MHCGSQVTASRPAAAATGSQSVSNSARCSPRAAARTSAGPGSSRPASAACDRASSAVRRMWPPVIRSSPASCDGHRARRSPRRASARRARSRSGQRGRDRRGAAGARPVEAAVLGHHDAERAVVGLEVGQLDRLARRRVEHARPAARRDSAASAATCRRRPSAERLRVELGDAQAEPVRERAQQRSGDPSSPGPRTTTRGGAGRRRARPAGARAARSRSGPAISSAGSSGSRRRHHGRPGSSPRASGQTPGAGRSVRSGSGALRVVRDEHARAPAARARSRAAVAADHRREQRGGRPAPGRVLLEAGEQVAEARVLLAAGRRRTAGRRRRRRRSSRSAASGRWPVGARLEARACPRARRRGRAPRAPRRARPSTRTGSRPGRSPGAGRRAGRRAPRRRRADGARRVAPARCRRCSSVVQPDVPRGGGQPAGVGVEPAEADRDVEVVEGVEHVDARRPGVDRAATHDHVTGGLAAAERGVETPRDATGRGPQRRRPARRRRVGLLGQLGEQRPQRVVA